jgi:transcriptional regulator with XRE-family HTH domain
MPREYRDAASQGVPGQIRAARKAKGLTGVELAKVIGVTPAYISLIETGAKVPRVRKAVAIAVALGLEPKELRSWVLLEREKKDELALTRKGASSPRSKSAEPTLRPKLRSTPDATGKAPIGMAELPILDLNQAGRSSFASRGRTGFLVDFRVLPRGTGKAFASQVGEQEVARAAPDVVAGDWVVVTPAGRRLQPKRIYVLRVGSKTFLGRVIEKAGTVAILGGPLGEAHLVEVGETGRDQLILGQVEAVIRSYSTARIAGP